jgi:hypothetical protein
MYMEHTLDGSEYKILVGEAEGREPTRRPRHRREDNIKVDVKEIRCECLK